MKFSCDHRFSVSHLQATEESEVINYRPPILVYQDCVGNIQAFHQVSLTLTYLLDFGHIMPTITSSHVCVLTLPVAAVCIILSFQVKQNKNVVPDQLWLIYGQLYQRVHNNSKHLQTNRNQINQDAQWLHLKTWNRVCGVKRANVQGVIHSEKDSNKLQPSRMGGLVADEIC